jgi:Flp pilus assembly pilin Flp
MQSLTVVALRGAVLARFRSDEEGQDLLEYAFLCALIALVAVGAVSSVGNAVYTFFWNGIAQNVASNF